MVTLNTFKRGLGNGLHISWELAKVTVPIYIAITILGYTPVLPWIAEVCSPVMKLVGLPGEASLALIMGYTVNLYGAIGIILSLDLTYKQITIIAGMLLLSHCLLLETAVARKTGIKVSGLVVSRILLSVAYGVMLNLFY